MAYTSVASLLETIDLVNYHGDSSISPQFKDQITSLHKHTSFLQWFLEDGDPNRAKNWEDTIRDVADRAEEIIDLLVSDSLLKSSSGSKSELYYSFDDLDKVTEEMESTANRVKGRSTKANGNPDEELMHIVSLLREGSPNLETISIVGAEGVGKSALARNAYNHPLVREHFDVCGWSTVMRGHTHQPGIIHNLLHCIDTENARSYINPNAGLYRSLSGRRYLIVLYDVWTKKVWDDMWRPFPDNGNGSRIILTTDDYDLADSVSHVHEMRLLDEDKTWNLLRERVFNGDPCPSRLEHYGKIISSSCRGLQLAIEVVSGILSADQTEAAWEDVSENAKIASGVDDYRIPQVLSLGYMYLPHHLRPCFLFLVCFAEDNEIRVSRLVKMWVAEGFLNQSESKSYQEIGEECVEFLVRRSLVSIHSRKSNGRIKSITVHGLVQDMCLRQALMSNFIHNGRFEMSESCRRVRSSDYSHDFLECVYASTIRTVILYSIEDGEIGVGWSLGSVRLLRILDLSNAYDYDLPEEVFDLFHLRYLAFHSGFNISEGISNLQNLQTLIVCPRKNGRVYGSLPEGIWRMPQLRHFFNFSFKLPIPTLKEGEGENSALENLETLSRVVDFVCSKENLKMIPNVKKLALLYTKSSRNAVRRHEFRNLISMHRLETLKIEFQCYSFVRKQEMSFAFPPTLKKLNMCGLHLPWEDMKIVASLPNLEVLKLRNHACVGDTWETSEGGFPRLEYLLIEVSNLKHWITESSHFPRLKSLLLHSCFHLSEVPREIREIPTLQLTELSEKGKYSYTEWLW